MYVTEYFGRFIAETNYDDLPEEVVSTAKERIMDSLGAAIAGSVNWEYAEQLKEACRPLGNGTARVIGGSRKEFPAARAAMIDATYAHAVELDDGHKNAGVHAGAVIVPTALVMGQELHCSGKDVITAVVLGYEVVYRIAVHMRPDQIGNGFHPSSNCGAYGAMAVAGKLMGLSAEQLANGLGQAGMLASGTMEATKSGQRSKCVQVGCAALNGITAACLAAAGMEGCLSALEGPNGMFITQAAKNGPVEDVIRGLGKTYSIADTYNKMYPSCRHVQPGIEGALDLAEKYRIAPGDVEKILIGTHQVAYDLTGKIKAPQNSGEAKFSLAYGAACALADHGFGVIHLTEEYYTKPELLELAGKAEISVDPEVQAVYPGKRGAKVRIILKNGREYEEELYDLKGSPDNPVGWAELEQKFKNNAMALMSGGQAEKLVKLLAELEKQENVDTLMGLV
ncbi:MAG TPA: hypothetical protein DCG70_08540 [Lachnoclostridium sp.]|nr:hypothetical protein [Lachnoclostridium sp.]